MEKNDKIIYDSGFGYEIGYFVKEASMYHHLSIDVVSGRYTGRMCISKDRVKPYSEELVKQLTERYGYEKSFSEDF